MFSNCVMLTVNQLPVMMRTAVMAPAEMAEKPRHPRDPQLGNLPGITEKPAENPPQRDQRVAPPGGRRKIQLYGVALPTSLCH